MRSASEISGWLARWMDAAIWRSRNWFRNDVTTSAQLPVGIRQLAVFGHSFGDEAPHFGRFALVQKRGKIFPAFIRLRGQPLLDNLPRERMRNPVHVQMQRRPADQIVVQQQ